MAQSHHNVDFTLPMLNIYNAFLYTIQRNEGYGQMFLIILVHILLFPKTMHVQSDLFKDYLC
jgi:hypothetical protein